jgi:predicted small lipoprotein YifL
VNTLRILLLCAACLLATACGKTGALYLPDDEPAAEPEQQG